MRPPGAARLLLGQTRMPLLWHGRPLKRWRWVGAFAEELMLCACVVRIGPARQAFWVIWDRRRRRLRQRTARLRIQACVDLGTGRLSVRGAGLSVIVEFPERAAGIQTLLGDGGPGFVWTRKRAGLAGRCLLDLGDGPDEAPVAVCVDDTAGYHRRETCWRWSTGAGLAHDGRRLAWNLVAGVNDPNTGSERSVWIDGEPSEVGPVRFARDLTFLEGPHATRLCFFAEASRTDRQTIGPVSSAYEVQLGRFAGELPAAGQLASGLGVMERHEARW